MGRAILQTQDGSVEQVGIVYIMDRAELVPLLLLPFAVTVGMASVCTHRSPRTKRGLLELAGAIKCSTGRSALSYMMYGCYCGLGGQGWPRDKADW